MSIPSTGVAPGVRFYVTLATHFVKFYLRHKVAIDALVSNGIVVAMDALAAAVQPNGEIAVLNEPGPE